MGLLLLASGAARAEPGLSLSIVSDDRFRGVSISGTRPVATAALSYDDVRGPYAGVSLTGGPAAGAGVRPLRVVPYVGVTRRLNAGLAIDAGITSRIYTRWASVEYARRFTEAYLGIVGRRWSSHLFYSPDYDGHGHPSLYGEIDRRLLDRNDWTVAAHVGVLAAPAGCRGARFGHRQADGRIDLTRRFGRLALTAAAVAAGPDDDRHAVHGTAVLALTRSF